jgi:hypothetical protein
VGGSGKESLDREGLEAIFLALSKNQFVFEVPKQAVILK